LIKLKGEINMPIKKDSISDELYKIILGIEDITPISSMLLTYLSDGQLSMPDIERVIFNNPATIVMWEDGTKTIVKCGEDDKYDQEKGLAMCICKKVYGNTGCYNDIFKKWIKEKSCDVKNVRRIGDTLEFKGECPNCGNTQEECDYCPDCGQKLKWNFKNAGGFNE
jgi:ribosomal protein L32